MRDYVYSEVSMRSTPVRLCGAVRAMRRSERTALKVMVDPT